MSLLENIFPKSGSTHSSKRLGRGNASGTGKTAGKGHKGQKARKGGSIKRGFEGGQMPMARRLPKFGFTNAQFKTSYEVVNLDKLNSFSGDVTLETLKAKGLVNNGPVKILGDGKLETALTITAHKFSKSAKAAIEKAGGKAEIIKPTSTKYNKKAEVKN